MKFNLKKSKALFLDRDGIINVDNGYTHKYENLNFIDGMHKFIKKYNELAIKLLLLQTKLEL